MVEYPTTQAPNIDDPLNPTKTAATTAPKPTTTTNTATSTATVKPEATVPTLPPPPPPAAPPTGVAPTGTTSTAQPLPGAINTTTAPAPPPPPPPAPLAWDGGLATGFSAGQLSGLPPGVTPQTMSGSSTGNLADLAGIVKPGEVWDAAALRWRSPEEMTGVMNALAQGTIIDGFEGLGVVEQNAPQNANLASFLDRTDNGALEQNTLRQIDQSKIIDLVSRGLLPSNIGAGGPSLADALSKAGIPLASVLGGQQLGANGVPLPIDPNKPAWLPTMGAVPGQTGEGPGFYGSRTPTSGAGGASGAGGSAPSLAGLPPLPGTSGAPGTPTAGGAARAAAGGAAASGGFGNIPAAPFGDKARIAGIDPTDDLRDKMILPTGPDRAGRARSLAEEWLGTIKGDATTIDPTDSARLGKLSGLVDDATGGLAAVDRFKLAGDKWKTFADETAPEYEAMLQKADQRASARGALKSGMLRTDIGNISLARARDLDTEKRRVFNDAIEGSISDQFNKTGMLSGLERALAEREASNRGEQRGERDFMTNLRRVASAFGIDMADAEQGDAARARGELRGERDYQTGQEQQGYDRFINEYLLGRNADSESFSRAMQLLAAGEGGNPAYLLSQLGQNSGLDPQTIAMLAQAYGQSSGGTSSTPTTGTPQLPPGVSTRTPIASPPLYDV